MINKCEVSSPLSKHPIFGAIEKMRLNGNRDFTGRYKFPLSAFMIAFEIESVQEDILDRLIKEIKKNSCLNSEKRFMEMMGSVGVYIITVH